MIRIVVSFYLAGRRAFGADPGWYIGFGSQKPPLPLIAAWHCW
jgi:hypothetical protein